MCKVGVTRRAPSWRNVAPSRTPGRAKGLSLLILLKQRIHTQTCVSYEREVERSATRGTRQAQLVNTNVN